MVAKILPLPEVVRSQLRSGVTITSVAQCVEELVLNSLDAGATCVAVRVDLSIFRIQVVDNGEGVPQTDLKYLGRRHATSKCHTLKDLSNHLSHYGFRGEALASTINLSAVVDITTHPRGSTQTFTKLFTYGKEKSVDTLKTNRPSIGTTITIQDFMYNMPVRRKLIREAIDLESIRMRLESFALMHPKVAFSLRNDRNGNMIIQTKKSSGTMATFMQLFGEERAQGLAEVHHSVNQFTVSGYIGTQPHLTKALQFVFVNRRVILRTKIHRMVNDLLARSSIISTRLHPSSVGPVKNPSSPPKGMKLYGIFVLNIECPYSEYDISLDPSKTLVEFKEWDQLLLCIEELILKFAREENLGISLDERYRRSGKEREEREEEEEEISLSQGSHSCFQLFSLKRSSEDGEASGPAKQKYGHTLNTQDNLLAVHSLMVKRIRKDTNESKGPAGKKNSTNELDNNREVTEECNKDKKDGSDLPKKTDDALLSTLRNKAKKNCCEDSRGDGSKANRSPETLNKDTEDSYSQCVEGTLEETERNPVNVQDKHLFQFEEVSTKENSISKDKNVTEGSESDEVVSLATRKREGVRSVLEEFKKVMEEVNEKGSSTESNLDLALPLTEKSTQQECRDRERVQQNNTNDTLSTLEEFMDFHNREQEKSIWDGFHTPEGDVMSTPASPPPLKSPHPSSPFPRAKNGVLTLEMLTERIEQSSPVSKSKRKCEFETRHRTSDFDYDEFAEKKRTGIHRSEHRSEKKTSLSKALSEKLKMHQNKSKTILSLHEKFGFSKTNASQSKVETHSLLSNQPVRGGGSSSSVGDSSDVAPVECPRLNTHSAKNEGGGRRRMGDEICSNALGSIDCLQVSRHTTKCEDGSRVGSDKDSSVFEPMDCLQNTHTGKTEDMKGEQWAYTSFRFKPVITRTFQEVDTCLSYVQPYRETVDMDLGLDNQVVVDVQCRGGEGRDQNPVVSSPLVYGSGRNVGGDDGEGDSVTIHSQYVTACSQPTTPPKKSNALLYIAESYASTPEDGDASPQKPNTPLRVPICLSFEDNLACPQSISLRNHQGGEQLNLGVIPASLNFTHGYEAYESRNITGEEDRFYNTVMEGEAPRLLNGSFHVNGSHSKFHCRRDCHKEMSIACEKHLNNSVEKGVNFKASGNSFDLQTTSGSVPITQSFVVNDSETQQRSQSEEQEKKDDKYLHEDAHHLQASQGFTPPKAKPLGVHQQSASVGNESFVLDCSALAQKVTRSAEVLNNTVEPKELTREKTENQEPDSIMLIPLSQTSQEEIYLENTLSLPSQVIMENDPVNYNDKQKPLLSEKMTLQTRSQPLSQGVVHSEEAEGPGKVTTGPEVMSAGQGSPNPLSESLHFSQLTLPDDGATEPSHGTSPSLDMLPAVLTDSISVPSSMSRDTGSESKVLPLWDIDFQVNHTENRNMNNKVSVDETKGLHSDAVTMLDATETAHDSGDCQNVVLEPTLRLPSGLPPLIQSIDTTARSFENSSSFKDIPSLKASNSCEGGSNTKNSTNRESYHCKNLTLREKSSCQNTSEQMEMQIPPHGCKWREAVDKDGRTVYVDLQTGNSSYDPPEIKDTPEWTSSQPLGARLLRVPLTYEPWYIPRGKGERERDSFTLSHGFKEFMSWKKTIEMRKRESANRAVSTKDSNSAEDGMTKATASSMSQEVQEAIKTLLEDCEAEDDSVKWTEKPEACLRGPAEPLEVAQICQMWEPPDFAMDAEVLNSGPDAGAAPRSVAGVRVYNMVHPYRFSRDMLPSCKVLGQLDQKFIACTLKYSSPEGPPGKASQLVVLFDQHAVHERVLLESIIQENFETLASGESVLCTAAVSPPLELDLPEDEVRLMQAYSKKFNQRGLYFTKTSPSRVMFQLIPSCLVAREANELRHKRCQTAGAIVESVVRDLCHTLHQTGGVLGLIPHPITHVFNNNACRGAIKFGDELTREQCQDLISSLYSCQLPFQCAHGRPSIVPLVNLTQLASCPHKVSKPNLRRLREAMEAGTVL